jgi:hypothetical protein
MKNRCVVGLITLVAPFVMLACGSDVTVEEDDVTPGDPLAGQLVWMGVSGEPNGVNGAWLAICEPNGLDSEQETITVSGDTIFSTYVDYSGNTVCSGVGTPGSTQTIAITLYGTKTGGWAGTPPAGLASTLTVSRWEFAIGGSPVGKRVSVVDDRASPRVFYMGNGGAVDGEGFPTDLDETRPYIEQ